MNIALIGYGKMGQAIEEMALSKGHTIELKIDVNNAHEFTKENMANADVAIEFTGPHSALANVMKCLEWRVPVVCGSTGWLDQWETARACCLQQEGTLIYASNYSVGVNLFFELNKQLAGLMNAHTSYDVLLQEIHHTEKKDAPSGTAISLAEQLLASIHRKKQWVNQPSTDPADLVIASERIDPAPGTHKVKYQSPIDDIEIIHTAHNRKGFAGGAVLAAEFTASHQGIFSMKEVLGL